MRPKEFSMLFFFFEKQKKKEKKRWNAFFHDRFIYPSASRSIIIVEVLIKSGPGEEYRVSLSRNYLRSFILIIIY